MAEDSGDVATDLESMQREFREGDAVRIELATEYLLGENSLLQGNYAQALRLFASVAAKAENLHPQIHGAALNKVGTAFTQAGQPAIGLEWQERALQAHRALRYWPGVVIDLIQAAQSCVTVGLLERAQRYADELERLGPQYPPPDVGWVTYVPALVASRQGRWEKAIPAFRATIRELERTRKQFLTADQQRLWCEQKADMYGNAIEAAILGNSPQEAMTYLELARNRYLALAVGQRAAPTERHEELRCPELDGSPISADSLAGILPADCALVWCGIFPRGLGIVAAVREDSVVTVHSRFYEEVTARELRYLFESANPQRQSGPSWGRLFSHTVTDVRKIVWTRIIETIAASVTHIVLLPSVGCSELPLAAAAPDRTSNGRLLTVSIAPSLGALTPSADRAIAPPKVLLQVENPSEDRRLVCCSIECAAVRAMFVGESLLIRGRRAGRDRILRSLPGADVFHFAGHAFCDWTEPLDSGLLCATRKDGADTVRVRDLLALARSVDTRLIVLSACQIGNVQAGDKQNDFINLPSALLAAGARAVIAPRWLVNDVATSMFLTNLFEHWLCKGESLPIALFSARQWLRDRVTRSDVERWLEKRRPDVVDLDRLQALKNTYVEKYRPDERPFDHVAHWGAFELTGDPYPFGGKTCLSLY